MYETYYDKIEPYFGERNMQLHYMDTSSFAKSINTKDFVEDLQNFENFLTLAI